MVQTDFQHFQTIIEIVSGSPSIFSNGPKLIFFYAVSIKIRHPDKLRRAAGLVKITEALEHLSCSGCAPWVLASASNFCLYSWNKSLPLPCKWNNLCVITRKQMSEGSLLKWCKGIVFRYSTAAYSHSSRRNAAGFWGHRKATMPVCTVAFPGCYSAGWRELAAAEGLSLA